MTLVETPSPTAFEHLLACVAEPVLIVDAAGAPVRTNAAARALVAPLEADARTRANLEAVRALVRGLPAAPARGALDLFDLTRRDGEPVAFQVSAGPAPPPGEEHEGRLLVLRDPREAIPAGVSHELRSPLTAILGYSVLLLRGLGGDLTPKQKDKLERIHSNGERLLQLIDERRA